MKKKLLTVAMGIFVLFCLFNSGVSDALIAFLLVGAVPGTTYSLSPSTMLLIIGILLWLTTLRFAALPLISMLRINRLARHHLARKERMPKRRFSQI